MWQSMKSIIDIQAGFHKVTALWYILYMHNCVGRTSLVLSAVVCRTSLVSSAVFNHLSLHPPQILHQGLHWFIHKYKINANNYILALALMLLMLCYFTVSLAWCRLKIPESVLVAAWLNFDMYLNYTNIIQNNR